MRTQESSLYILVMYVLFLLLLGGCDLFKNREIKSAAKHQLMEQIASTLDQEQSSIINGVNTRGKDFNKYVQNHTEVEIQSVQEVTASDYLLQTKVHTINPKIRQIVLEILAKMDDRTATAFNFANGIQLIHQQKPEIDVEVDQPMSIELKNHDGRWTK